MVSAGTGIVGDLGKRTIMEEIKKERTARLLSLYAQIWLYQIIGIAMFVIARIVFLLQHTSGSTLLDNIDCMPLFAWNSWRFDAQSITYISLPVIIPALVAPFLKKEKAVEKVADFARKYYMVMLTVLALIVVAEFYYYDNFQSRYNVVFFDFFDEGPLGLLRTMWEDYPVIWILIFISAIGYGIHLLGKRISRKRIAARKWMGTRASIISVILILGLSFVFIRGSITTYTLQVEAFMVSPDDNINAAVPNAIYLLKKAYKERVESFELKSDSEVLKEEGFSSIEEAVETALLQEGNFTGGDEVDKAIFRVMERGDSTPHKQPNVLLIMNESWSNFLVDFDKGKELDLLCSLRPHLQEDILLQNFQSVRNGTIYSLETVMLAMPYLHFFQSRYRYTGFEASIAYPFKQSGYQTSFITGMDPTWENLNEGLKIQHFDRIEGRQQVMHAIKESTTSEIGVYDEFLYSYILRQMNEAAESGTPQFVMALTTTNHPPFTYPDNMNLPPLTGIWYNSPQITGDDDVKEKYGLGAQYANRCLGDFLNEFKKSPLAKNTIVVVTGDHNVRSILDYDYVPERYKHSVPLYIYLPEEYSISEVEKEIVEQRYGCHFDLLPTIASLAFSDGVKYLCIGNDLLDTSNETGPYISYNEEMVIAPEKEDIDKLERIVAARLTLMKLYYQRIFRTEEEKKE